MRKSAQKPGSSSVTITEVKEKSEGDTDSGQELMQAVLAKPRKSAATEFPQTNKINGVVIGTLSEPSEDGRPMVYYPGIPTGKPLAAISTQSLGDQNTGHEVALGFVDGDPALPIVLGLIQNTTAQDQATTPDSSEDQNLDVQLDGDRLTLSAEYEIILKCGKSSITLTRAGKIIVKGAYLSNHATGVNRIKGGSVQIN